MKMRNIGFAVLMMFGLGACAGVETATRNTPNDGVLEANQPARALTSVTVSGINVRVPDTLRVSEANRYYPGGDIVWREDPIGNRHEQVETIMMEGLRLGASRVQGTQPVIVDVEVTRFHALTEKARYTVGGVHAVQFKLRILDPATLEPLGGTKLIKADFDALGGAAAIAAENRGVTQKVRITNQVAAVLEAELTQPGGYQGRTNGIIGLINQIK